MMSKNLRTLDMHRIWQSIPIVPSSYHYILTQVALQVARDRV